MLTSGPLRPAFRIVLLIGALLIVAAIVAAALVAIHSIFGSVALVEGVLVLAFAMIGLALYAAVLTLRIRARIRGPPPGVPPTE